MLIIVCGLPGTGKTTFAEALARELGACHLSSDRLREASQRRGKYDEATKLKVYEEMHQQMDQLINVYPAVILDATFYKGYLRKLISEYARDRNQALYFIQIVAEEKEVLERLKQKRRFSEADPQVYQQIKHRFEELESPHLSLNSSQLRPDEMVVRAKAYISSLDYEPIPDRSTPATQGLS